MVHGSTARPLRAVGMANLAVGAATRRSQAMASCVPAPMAAPFTEASTGTGVWVMAASMPYRASRNRFP